MLALETGKLKYATQDRNSKLITVVIHREVWRGKRRAKEAGGMRFAPGVQRWFERQRNTLCKALGIESTLERKEENISQTGVVFLSLLFFFSIPSVNALNTILRPSTTRGPAISAKMR